MQEKPVTSVNVIYDVALVTVDHLPNDIKLISDIFSSIAAEKVNIDMISQVPPYRNNVNISFSLSSNDLIIAISALNRFKKQIPDLRIEVDANNTKLSVFGKEMKNIPGVAAKLFTIMANNGIEIKLVTTSEIDISFLIYEKDVDRAIQSIKTEYQLV